MNTPVPPRHLWPAAVLDAALILLFAAIGRDAHHQTEGALGVLATAWPFLAGAAIGWVAGRVWKRPLAVWPSGISVWLGALVGGMVLRALTGQVVVLPFIIVAALFLALVLLGWRALWALARMLLLKRKTL
ncbi:DUF3054 domain-containing protein [Arthrobacter sp. NPDC090010]|uniref:DUF3054 domain-containing protein n=1 Tax=Arthrobacter sp. NPDC090010 TaxID=3363942 RepID=UPI00381F817A